MNNYTFDIKTSQDFFKKLLDDYEEFCKNKTSPRIALNCAMTAWHLIDWLFREKNPTAAKQEIGNFRKPLIEKCPSLQIMRDLTTGAKHYTISDYTPKMKSTELKKGAFSKAFSRGFDIPSLIIELQDGTKIYFEDEIQKVIDFWTKYFE